MINHLLILFFVFALIGSVFAGVTPPETTFSYEQIPNTTDTNITLSCTDVGSGCKAINYNINNEGWNTIFANNILEDFEQGNLDEWTIVSGTATIQNATTMQGNYFINVGGNGATRREFDESDLLDFNFMIRSNAVGSSNYLRLSDSSNNVLMLLALRINEFQYGTSFTAMSGTPSNNTNYIGRIVYRKATQRADVYFYAENGTLITSALNVATTGSGAAGVRIELSSNQTMGFDYLVSTGDINLDSYSFLYSGAGDHNIQYFSTDFADNNESIKTSFFTTYGLAKFTLKDENSGLDLDDVTYTISPSINGDSGGTLTGVNELDLNLTGITSQEYTLTFSKTGYGTRTYQTTLNQFSDIDINFALLPTTLSTDIPFKVYRTDQTTIFANTFIELYQPDTGFIIGRKKTNSSGEVTFSIHVSDQNYLANINNGEFTYQPVALTVLYPKDEETLNTITERWRIDITQNLFESFTDLNTDKVIYLLPNTALPFNIRIADMNGNYFARTYAQQFPGNPLTATLQPYLVPINTGLLTTITTKSSITNQAVPGITIKIYKNISGEGRTLVEQVITDDKGQALVLLILNAEYEFETYQDAEFLKTFTINATSSNIFLLLPFTTVTLPTDPSGFVAQFTPNRTGLNKINVGSISFTQTLNNFAGLSFTGTSEIVQNGVVLSTQTITATTSTESSYTRTINWTDINKGTLISRLTIVVSGQTYTFEQTYFINDAFGTDYDILAGLSSGLRSDFVCPSTGICWTLLILGIIISVIIGIYGGMLMGNLTSQSAGIIFLIPMILFTYLTWIPFELTAGIVIILLAFIINERR